MWNPSKAHFVDLMMLDYVGRKYDTFNIAVCNRWGFSVCGLVRPNSEGRILVKESAEHDWELFIEEKNNSD